MTNANLPSPVILFVDDEEGAIKYFQRAIGALAQVVTARTVEEGKRMLDMHAETLAVLVSDQRMPGGYGNELLQYAKQTHPHLVRILTTAYSELQHTIDAVNQGQIHRYIEKPWDITVLRMEVKQALELAGFLKEHEHLVREKLEVRQKQTIASRIGTLETLCIGVTGPDHFLPVDTYLNAASLAGLTPPVPNWLLTDYFELVSAEARRSGKFGYAVRNKLSELKQAHVGHRHPGPQILLAALAETLSDKVKMGDDDGAELIDERNLTEFLESPVNTPVSDQHVAWLAYLLWLDSLGWCLKITRSENRLLCHLTKAASDIAPNRLACWIEQF